MAGVLSEDVGDGHVAHGLLGRLEQVPDVAGGVPPDDARVPAVAGQVHASPVVGGGAVLGRELGDEGATEEAVLGPVEVLADGAAVSGFADGADLVRGLATADADAGARFGNLGVLRWSLDSLGCEDCSSTGRNWYSLSSRAERRGSWPVH